MKFRWQASPMCAETSKATGDAIDYGSRPVEDLIEGACLATDQKIEWTQCKMQRTGKRNPVTRNKRQITGSVVGLTAKSKVRFHILIVQLRYLDVREQFIEGAVHLSMGLASVVLGICPIGCNNPVKKFSCLASANPMVR